MKELSVEAIAENLNTVLDFIGGELEACGCNMKTQTQINIAAEEVFINIAHYAYAPENGGAVVRIAAGSEVVIEFEDKGTAYNPLLKEDPDITKTAEEREIGGLGIFMVKKFMDAVEYRREADKNILTLRKSC